MNKQELIHLEDTLIGIRNATKDAVISDVKFFYAVKKNLNLIKEATQTIRKELIELYNRQKDPREEEFDKKRIALCVLYSEKVPNGGPIIENGHYKLIEATKNEFEEKFKELSEEYKDVIDLTKNDIDKAGEILQQNIDVKLYKLSSDDLPKSVKLTQKDIDALMPIIED